MDVLRALLSVLLTWSSTVAEDGSTLVEDILQPYLHRHGARHSHRHVRDCQPARYNNVTHEIYKSHFSSDPALPVYQHSMFTQSVGPYSWDQHDAIGNIIWVNNPFKTFTVVEPGGSGGCQNHTKSTVTDTARSRNCLVASNAGFFNTTSHECLGNLVIEGVEILNNGGIQNAHFGIKKDGSLFTGYLPETRDLSQEFEVLVGGVLWLVRDGVNYVEEALKAECSDIQETGSMRTFADVISARTAVGHDAQGRVVMAQIDGKTWQRGINLIDLADLLIQMGVVNAINTDGGGSATLVVNNTVVNHPSDYSLVNDIHYTHARKVSTALCVHDLPCSSHDCHGHGTCHHGTCYCHGNWVGVTCDRIQCGALNCSTNGVCTQHGCACKPGWLGPDCTSRCPTGRFGAQCAHTCRCANGASCNHVDGSCECMPGYAGLLCDQECPYGMYGEGCRQICYCEDSCYCHHVTGACNVSHHWTPFWLASKCLAEQYITERHLVRDHQQEYRAWLVTTTTLAVLAATSIILNIIFMCIHCIMRKSNTSLQKGRRFGRKSRKTYTSQSVIQRSVFIGSYSSDEDSGRSDELDTGHMYRAVENKREHVGSDRTLMSEES